MSTNYKLIKYFWILLFIIEQLIIKIKCQCEECTISNCISCNNCRLFVDGDTQQCLECSGINDNDYYYKKEDGTCEIKNINNLSTKFLIESSKQIVDNCISSYPFEMGSICYKTQPKNSVKGDDDKYKCLYNYTKETIDNLEYLNCLDLYKNCPSDYKYFTIVNQKYYQCTKDFNDCNDKIYEEKIGDESNYYCLRNCPSTKKYFYAEGDNKNKCIEKCNFESNGDYFLSNELQCKIKNVETSCNGHININKEKNIFECVESVTECSDDYPYLFEKDSLKYCLKSCKYTESIEFLGKIKTYIFENTNTDATNNYKYKCLDNTNSVISDQYYKDELELKWVSSCKTSISGPYYNKSDSTCYNSCEKYYKDFECVEECHNNDDTDDLYIYRDESTKICYTKCPTNLGKGFYNSDNICQSCNLNEGYYKSNDQRCYSDSGNEKCKFFEENYYYNYDDNFCFIEECKDYSKYKYHAKDEYKCYKSCSDLNTDSIEYKFEKDYICYIEDPNNNIEEESFKYKYKSSSEFTKYITENQLTECLELDLKYLKNFECIKECAPSDYIILPQQNRMGQCLSNEGELTEDNGCKYYNKSKICSNQCNFYKILENGNLAVFENENCVEKCPNNYYENAIDKTCLRTCGNGLYNDEATHKCVSKCNPGFYKVNPNRCVDKCKTGSGEDEKFAYYMDTGECKSECPETHPYSYDPTEDHQLCLKNCPKYSNNDKICMDECKYYSNGNCVDSCSGFGYIHPGNICSNEECPKSAPFFYSDSSTDPSFKICNTSCPENYYKNYKSGGATSNNNNIECIKPCGGVIFNDGCYDACPNGLYNSNGNCITNCPQKFYKSGNGYKCIDNCNKISEYPYLTSSGECVKDCPLNENYIGNDNNCLNKCENDGYFELFKEDSYNIYKCVSNCLDTTSNNFYVNGTKLCISNCGELYVHNNVCYRNCLGIENHSYSLKKPIEGVNEYTCEESCGDNKYYDNNHICIDSCNELPFNKTANHSNSCVTECDLKSDYKFLEKGSDSNSDKLFCKDKCSNGKRYLTSNYVCIDVCPSPYIFVVINENDPVECQTKCPDDKPYATKNENGEYECSETKCSEYYYPNNYTCTENCNKGDYVLETDDLKICTSNCDYYKSQKLYYFENEKCVFNCKDTNTNYKYTSIDGKCVDSCNENEFYDEDDFVCKFRCPTGKKIDGQICREKCNDVNKDLNKYENENGYCVDSCTESKTTYIYNKEGEFKCLNNCSDLYIDDNVCKSSCGSKFISGKNCVAECEIPKQFYKIEDDKKICLSDCPEEKIFYTDEGNNKYMCTDECNAYIQNLNPNINAKKCIGDCKGDYPYYILEDEDDENPRKICFSSCPSSHPYYSIDKDSNSQNLKCYKECPETEVHLPNEYKCDAISECGTKIINYKKKECIERCPITDSFYVKDGIKYCVDNCTFAEKYILKQDNALKLTYNKECVATCPENSKIDGKLCVCQRLFYLDRSTGVKTCLKEDLTLCESISGYPIINIDTNECTDYCDGILSLSGFECYNYNYKCKQNETLKTFTNGNKQCDCVDKYYYITENERQIKKCLGENEECPSSYSMYIKDTKECVKECPTTGIYNKQYGKTCVSTCPSSTTENNGICECSGKWYVTDSYEVICLDGGCPINKELLIEETKQCVSSCIGTDYEVYFNKTCIKNCEEINDRDPVDSVGNSYVEKISKQYCRCIGPWYYDINGNEICNKEKTYCEELEGINLKFTISPTKQCVKECPSEYKYSFGHQCFKNCEIASTSLNQELLTDDNLKTCKCKNYWTNEDNGIKCLDSYNSYKLINYTKECIDINENCPKEYPLLFNNICYKSGKCPEEKNVHYDNIKQECKCIGKWYINSGEIICLDDNKNCPTGYPYLIHSTKECKESKDDSLYEFNNIFYNNCPQSTVADESSGNKICICNPSLGYYYFTLSNDGIKMYQCAQDKCPTEQPLNEDQKKECITDCTEEYPYLYQGICYKKCPNLTEKAENSNECQIKSLDNEITLENLEKQMSENIVELYSKSNIYSSQNVRQKIVTTNATVEFYGVNRNNKGNGNKNIQSDLSYIDISLCIDKIYKTNKMDSNDDIIILKYDLNMIPKKMLINPVEYKFINSRTGQELDATVCEHNSIKISYPVHDLINKYDKMTKNLRKLEYIKIDLTSNNKESLREKLDKGKEIIQDYSDTDIFNINDRIYSDICIAVEVDGKDLTLEDRINYLYPQLALCENNCTYNSTDFINERIYCDCSYKIEFDFGREYSTPFEINIKEVNNNQKGNSNIAVMKCISNLKDSKSLKNNGGFLYTLIMILIEVVLSLIIIFYGINSLSNRLKNKMVESEDDLDQKKITVVTSPKKRIYEDVKTSQRILDNPPKKKVADFDMEFIPQEYLFLFFNKGEKSAHKKLERNNLPFKIGLNTKILLEKIKGVNYNNIKPTGPFPPGQNLIFIIDSMDENMEDYLKLDNEGEKGEQNNENSKDKKDDEVSEKKSEKPTIYKKGQLENSDYDPSDENYSIFDIDEEMDGKIHEKTFIDALKKNQRLIKKNYSIAIKNKNTNFFETLLTEIIDKIYIIKILFFTRKFDILTLQLSVYLLCHTLLLVLNALFFDVKTIKKIWREENYPGLGYYLGYGLLSCIIIWIIYKIFLCLLSNNDKTKEVLKMIHINNKYNLGKIETINKKYSNLIWKIKFKISIYSIIEFLILIFCFLYLSVFCSVYTGTQSKVFKAYGIALVEVLIIKIIYGIVLAILRYISISYRKKGLYDAVLFMNTYLV